MRAGAARTGSTTRRRSPEPARQGPRLSLALCAACALAAAACASPPPELKIESGPDADVTLDGLHKVVNPTFRSAWVRPGADFSGYSGVLLEPVGIAYARKPRSSHARHSGSNFALSEGQMSDMQRWFRHAFEKQLARIEGIELVEEAGAQVLRVEPALIDLVMTVPTEAHPGSSVMLTTSTAEMTLLLELRDARSDVILARIIERREATAAGFGGAANLYESNAVTNSDAIKRLFRRWAEVLAERMEEMRQTKPVAQPLES